jgi:predicted double-glycine peptidase
VKPVFLLESDLLRKTLFMSLTVVLLTMPTGVDAGRFPEAVSHRVDMPRVGDVDGLIHIPITRQATNYTCGAAAVGSILHWLDPQLDFSEDHLAAEMKSHRVHGTSIANIERYVRRLGLVVDWRNGWTMDSLEQSVKAGIPVLVLIQAYRESDEVDWSTDWDDGHFVVVNGLDERNVYMMDPSQRGNYTFIPRAEFLARWHDQDLFSRHYQFGMTFKSPFGGNQSLYDRDEIIRLP